MNTLKKSKGITLIALVITIIILLILAGISISSLTNNGLFGKTQDAKIADQVGKIQEEINLWKTGHVMSKYTEMNTRNLETFLQDLVEDKLLTEDQANEVLANERKEIVIGEKTLSFLLEGETPLLRITDTADTKPSQAMPEGATVIENNPSKGVVIADKNGNEWTWVEVPKTRVFTTAQNATDYENIKTDLINYATDYRSSAVDWTDKWYDGCGVADSATYTQMYNKMLSSVYTNGGFWISRYEIGDATSTSNNYTNRTSSSGITGTAVSKPDQIPYNWVTCSQAQTLASGMSTDTNKMSSLLFGIQWDLTCKFLEEKSDLEKTDIISTSKGWGNFRSYSLTLNRGMYLRTEWIPYTTDTENAVKNRQKLEGNAVLLTTGASEDTNKMNIYDLAGNVSEWTLEYHTSSYGTHCVRRGWDNGSYAGYARCCCCQTR